MHNFKQINESIATRHLYESPDEGTYYTQKLFDEFCVHMDLKRVTIFGFYKPKYGWTDEQALEMYNKCPDGWTDGQGVYRAFDWGRGENKIARDNSTDRDWHEPHLDHIVPRSKGGTNEPSNFQVLPRKLNIILSNLTDEEAPALVPLLIAQFPDLKLS